MSSAAPSKSSSPTSTSSSGTSASGTNSGVSNNNKTAEAHQISFTTWNQWNKRDIPPIMPNVNKGGNPEEYQNGFIFVNFVKGFNFVNFGNGFNFFNFSKCFNFFNLTKVLILSIGQRF